MIVALNSQCQIIQSFGDTVYFELVDFENGFEYLQIDTSSQNIWEIAMPSKVFFDSSYSSSKAIITDSINAYPSNNLSYFDIILTQNEPPIPWVGGSLLLSFRHKFDTDTLIDGGFITVSFDQGESWQNIIDPIQSDYWVYYGSYPGVSYEDEFNKNIYTSSDSIMLGHKGYSGNSGGWINTSMAWLSYPVKSSQKADLNQQIIRFNFISDSIDNNREGWMIDDIAVYAIDLGSSTTPLTIQPTVKIFPNPMKEIVTIEANKDISRLRIYNQVGQLVEEMRPNSHHVVLFKRQLSNGLYTVDIAFENGQNMSSRLLIIE